MTHATSKSSAKSKPRRFWRHRGGNVAIITALVMIPLTFALGMAYDFTMAQSRKDQIDGMADVATLGSVTPTLMTKSSANSQTQAISLFNGQIATVSGVSYDGSTTAGLSVTANDTTSANTVNRTVTLSYHAASINIFATLLGMKTFPISGGSTAVSSAAPNIDFYLMMDTSPSMEIAATSAGIATMIANTQQESDGTGTADSWSGASFSLYASGGKFKSAPNGNGCAFGCHQSDPSDLTGTGCVSHTDPATNKATTNCQFLTQAYKQIPCTTSGSYADGTTFTASSTFPESGRDNYDLSRCVGVTLRIDLLNTAAQNLMDAATTMETQDGAAYRMAIYESAYNNQSNPLTLYQLQALTSSLSTAKTSAATLGPLEMCRNNQLACGDSNGDMDSNLDGNLTSMLSIMPTPGNGTNNKTDTPQEVLFIVTDAQNDLSSSGRSYSPMDLNATRCTAIKNKGIRIAVLYTTYTPLEESWYQTAVEPYLGYSTSSVPYFTGTSDKLAAAATACASTGLFYQVSTDGDVSAALVALFQKAVATARLIK